MVVGEHQKFASALLVPDFDSLKDWGKSQNLSLPQENREMINHPDVIKIFNEEILKLNKSLSEFERIHRFRIVPDDWSPVTGELSPSLKLKRKVIQSKYQETLDQIYSK